MPSFSEFLRYVEPARNDYGQHLVIENPNSWGQGYCPNHADNPHHEVITKYGWVYSHTTRIRCVDGSYIGHHTYKRGDHNVGVDCRPGWKVNAGKGGIGRYYPFFGSQVERYLKRKSRELTKAGQ